MAFMVFVLKVHLVGAFILRFNIICTLHTRKTQYHFQKPQYIPRELSFLSSLRIAREFGNTCGWMIQQSEKQTKSSFRLSIKQQTRIGVYHCLMLILRLMASRKELLYLQKSTILQIMISYKLKLSRQHLNKVSQLGLIVWIRYIQVTMVKLLILLQNKIRLFYTYYTVMGKAVPCIVDQMINPKLLEVTLLMFSGSSLARRSGPVSQFQIGPHGIFHQ